MGWGGDRCTAVCTLWLWLPFEDAASYTDNTTQVAHVHTSEDNTLTHHTLRHTHTHTHTYTHLHAPIHTHTHTHTYTHANMHTHMISYILV